MRFSTSIVAFAMAAFAVANPVGRRSVWNEVGFGGGGGVVPFPYPYPFPGHGFPPGSGFPPGGSPPGT
ncbi:hypothetical protein FB645_006240, partial [Coemansia sp. IMI 203386]